MPSTIDRAASPWRIGSFQGRSPELLFGFTYEDPLVELRAFAPRSRVFAIAAAGSTARALAAAGHDVTAVDINPCQLEYARSRAADGLALEGAAERLLLRGRGLLVLAGWTEEKRRTFLAMDDPAAQIEHWREAFDSRAWRVGLDTLLSHWLLRLVYASPFVTSMPRGFGAIVRSRLERGWAMYPNRTNPYAWHLLLGETLPENYAQPATPIRFVCADAAQYLESCAPSSFDAFSLSNILDGAPVEYADRVYRAVERAASPGAVIVTRSFKEPESECVTNLAASDRSLIWGTVEVR
jgi:S-adenosylmethionine:diacylglycerol 3-amino-3-carboxypropyl transferase